MIRTIPILTTVVVFLLVFGCGQSKDTGGSGNNSQSTGQQKQSSKQEPPGRAAALLRGLLRKRPWDPGASLGKSSLSAALWVLGTAAVVLGLTLLGGEDGPLPTTSTAAESGGESVFVHRATPQNTSANSTYLDHPLTNDNPNAVLSVTQNWNPGGDGGIYNDHPVGVWYDANARRWAIFNQDRVAMPGGASFNAVVWATEAPVPESPTASTQQ